MGGFSAPKMPMPMSMPAMAPAMPVAPVDDVFHAMPDLEPGDPTHRNFRND